MDKDKFIKITSTQSRAEAEQIVQILKENNIAAYSQGGVMNIYMGTSVTGEDIFVSEADQEAAKTFGGVSANKDKCGFYEKSFDTKAKDIELDCFGCGHYNSSVLHFIAFF